MANPLVRLSFETFAFLLVLQMLLKMVVLPAPQCPNNTQTVLSAYSYFIAISSFF